MTVLACERLARDVGAKKTSAPVEAPAPAAVVQPGADGELEKASDETPVDPPAPSTDEIRDELAERAQDATPVPLTAVSSASAPARRSAKAKGGKQKIERPTMEVDGQRAIVVEALLHFDGEDTPRIVSWR